MKDLIEQFNEVIDDLKQARNAYLSNAIEESRFIMDEWQKKSHKLSLAVDIVSQCQMCHDLEYKLTADDIQALQIFNNQLATLEKKIIKECQALKESGRKRLDSTDEYFLTCFRMHIKIEYYIGEDDPAYSDDRDNCIATSKRMGSDIIIYGDNDWNVMRSSDHPLAHQKHCWLFHDLYDHANLSWKDILRIRGINTHIIAYYGNDITIQKELLYERQQ
jgi:hypothetical protein